MCIHAAIYSWVIQDLLRVSIYFILTCVSVGEWCRLRKLHEGGEKGGLDLIGSLGLVITTSGMVNLVFTSCQLMQLCAKLRKFLKANYFFYFLFLFYFTLFFYS